MKKCNQTVYLAYGAICLPMACGKPITKGHLCARHAAQARRKTIRKAA